MKISFTIFNNFLTFEKTTSQLDKFKNFTFSLIFIMIGLIVSESKSQEISNSGNDKLLQINDSILLFKCDTINELWFRDKSLDIWKLNQISEIFTLFHSQLRIWRNANRISIWTFDTEIRDWKRDSEQKLDFKKLNDSISITIINDTVRWVDRKGKVEIYSSTNRIQLWNKVALQATQLINDTIEFQAINDTSRLWMNKNTAMIWKLNRQPKLWKVSNSTIVWTIDELTEFWKAGNTYNLWNRTSAKTQWEQNQKMQAKRFDSIFYYWPVNQQVIILSNSDSVQIWRAKPNETIWSYADSIKIWRLPPVRKTEIIEDSLIQPEKLVKKAELLDVGKSMKLWTVNDSMKLFKNDEVLELWSINKSVKLWKISDSTLIWNINGSTKISMISDTLSVWKKKEKEFDWKIDSTRIPLRINKNLLYLKINDSTSYTNINDTISIWNSFGSVRLASIRNSIGFHTLRDTVELWEPNDSTKLWIGKFDDTGRVWERNKKVNILNINDSTKIWQLNEDVRLSIISGKLKIWRQGIDDPNLSWRESKEFKRDKINDSTKIWYINPNTIIWETKHKIEVWNLNKDHEIYRINDTSLVFTYSMAKVPAKHPDPKYWTYLGTGKMDMAQVWVDKWAKGGENSISTLFIVNLQANYAKRKIKWNNDFEYRYGFLKPGDKSLRKNEDKIKITSIYNYYAFNKFYYGFSVTGLTQFFKGYEYVSDTVRNVVSDFLGPLYVTTALGLNYFPVKQFSVFFSPLTNKTSFVKDTITVNQETYGIPKGERVKREPGLILKSVLNWNITKSINALSKLDLFTRYHDLKKYNVDWETTITFKFTNFIQATLNTHLIYDPDVLIKQSDGSESPSIQFKEVFSIGLFYKI